MRHGLFWTMLFSLLLAAISGSARAADCSAKLLRDGPAQASDVRLADASRTASIYVDENDFTVVKIAADLLAKDVNALTGKMPAVQHQAEQLSADAVIVGTIGRSALIDQLVKENKLDVSKVRGNWETFVIATVEKPLPNVQRAVVIAGNDRRGTAYGVTELSEQIGASPWYWWADVTPTHRDEIAIVPGKNVVGPPSVKYRGIFINDEDWGLVPWASKTLDPQFGNVGPKTYEKVFELMLRLKLNYLWPAMHHCSTEFGSVHRNLALADEWGIVMGASHAEPMNRNNVWWDNNTRGPWRYDTNRDGVLKYWDEWAKKRAPYEAVWTVGMRGIHDSAMNGPKDDHERAKFLGQAIKDQRSLLEKYVAPDATKIPQAFMPYKEVLAQYRAGLELPDDVTLVWCDDNYGYIRQLSTPAEQKRSGHAGVYYHISYLGRPKPYLWLNTTPPALIWQQMKTAYAYGADRIWVVNVGDIKPGEIGMEFWAKLGWNIDRWGVDAQDVYLKEWATREFGADVAGSIASIMSDLYRLGSQRKPELMSPGVFAPIAERELATREGAIFTLLNDANALVEQVPANRREAFFELVQYPIEMAANTDFVFLNTDRARLAAAQGHPSEAVAWRSVKESVEAIKRETARYNDEIAAGKWKDMIAVGGFGRRGEYRGWGDEWFIPYPKSTVDRPLQRPLNADRLHVTIDWRPTPLIDGQAAAGAGDVDVSLVEANEVLAPWRLVGERDTRRLEVPNGGVTKVEKPNPAQSIAREFTIGQAGQYQLFGLVAAPSPDDDSFYLQIDDGAWITWNDLTKTANSRLEWRKQGAHELSAGKHTVRVAPREDGAGIRALRFTRRDDVEPMDDPAQTAPNELQTFVHGQFGYAAFDVIGDDARPEATANQPWIKVRQSQIVTDPPPWKRFIVEIDWDAAPKTNALTGEIVVSQGDKKQTLVVRGMRLPEDGTFGEVDGVVSMEAEHFHRATEGRGAKWTVIPHLGRTGDSAVTVLPATVESTVDVSKAPSLEYDFTTLTGDIDVAVHAYCLPSYPLHEGRGLRYAVAIDDEKPQIVNLAEEGGGSGEDGPAWLESKMRNIRVPESKHHLGPAGKHRLRVWMVDPNVILDKLVIDLGGLQPSELGPAETRVEPKPR
ncbi:MAG: glycosyl hydrolase 115 family protein [Tepidisphaeraceae bacterium]